MQLPRIYTELTDFWGWNPTQQATFWYALRRATGAIPVNWKKSLTTYCTTPSIPPEVFLNEVCAPFAMLGLIAGLVQEHVLTRQQANVLSEGILNATDKNGRWRDHRNAVPRRSA